MFVTNYVELFSVIIPLRRTTKKIAKIRVTNIDFSFFFCFFYRIIFFLLKIFFSAFRFHIFLNLGIISKPINDYSLTRPCDFRTAGLIPNKEGQSK